MYNQVQDECSQVPRPSFHIRKNLFETRAEYVFPASHIISEPGYTIFSSQRLDILQSYVHSYKTDSNPGSSPSEVPYHPSRIKESSRCLDSISVRSHSIRPFLSRSSLEGAIR